MWMQVLISIVVAGCSGRSACRAESDPRNVKAWSRLAHLIPPYVESIAIGCLPAPDSRSREGGRCFRSAVQLERQRYSRDHRSDLPANRLPRAFAAVATTDFFQTVGIPLLRGRTFTQADNAKAKHVVIPKPGENLFLECRRFCLFEGMYR